LQFPLIHNFLPNLKTLFIMSALQSNLSNPQYGYDFVVATTQESINATLKNYLYNSVFPTVKMYWNIDAQNNPVPVTYEELIQQTNGTDPFTVPSWQHGDPTSEAITNIQNSQFYFAFEASIGVPADVLPNDIPDIITLNPNSDSVTFNLICANFTIVSCEFGREGMTFENFSQPTDAPWLFTSNVKLANILNNSNLPKNIEAQLNNLGPNAYSVQQLMFDLDNAVLESIPNVSNLPSGSPQLNLLSQVFCQTYFSAMKAAGQPVLNYSFLHNFINNSNPSTFTPTSMEIEVSTYIDPANNTPDNAQLNTLCYLSAINGNKLPASVQFDWNWVEASEVANVDGVIAINKNDFINYFQTLLMPYVQSNCYTVQVDVTGTTDVKYSLNLTPGQMPTGRVTDSPNEVLNFQYTASDSKKDGMDGDVGQISANYAFDLNVTFSGNKIIISQAILLQMFVKRMLNSETWNAVYKIITDTYTMSVTGDGKMVVTKATSQQDLSQPVPKTNWFIELFTKLNDFTSQIQKAAASAVGTNFQDIPVSTIQQFVFPGGNTFAFKDVQFSDNLDLVSHITYVQPT
jgi:hypothetical protein